ncbi:MAG: thioredoxin domain-containing protein [Bacteroidetes bacterium]|nr:thioredoxin domain-containing protein [Bacteroidota bacterium]
MSQLTPPVSSKDHAEGPANAPVTLVEYGDFQCPHCGAAYPIVGRLQRHFGRQLRLVFRHFPLSNAHPYATTAAIAAEAAGRQGRFWDMHHMIFEHQDELDEDAVYSFAANLGLDEDRFAADMEDPALAEKVEADFESGVRSGVNGTPTFFIGSQRYNGGHDFLSLRQAIEAQLAHAL